MSASVHLMAIAEAIKVLCKHRRIHKPDSSARLKVEAIISVNFLVTRQLS